jgi:tellurite resistance protein TerC
MNVPAWLWVGATAVMVALIAIDLIVVARRPREPTMRECAAWASFYVAAAIAFGVGVLARYGGRYSGQFFSGWLTEYALSVDNLFVYLLIMTRLAVPREFRQRLLLTGVIITIGLRVPLILAGSAVVHSFQWVFYLFGAFLLYTAARLLVETASEQADDYQENALVRALRRALPISTDYNGARLTVRQGRRLIFTPLIVAAFAIGLAGLVFAFDSIPAIFGLTREPFLILSANLLALMGLRQLYFLIGGLIDRLAYLSHGLAVILAFIGLNLILQALHGNDLPFLNGGDPIDWAPEFPVWVSLGVITVTLLITAAISLRTAKPSADA